VPAIVLVPLRPEPTTNTTRLLVMSRSLSVGLAGSAAG
jgi:hypothetical protein